MVEVHRDWAPHGADHLYELVKNGFFDGDRFFRVVRSFVVQFGINGDPATQRTWAAMNIPDDRPTQPNARGTLTYAATGMPNSRSTQLFINLRTTVQSLNPQGLRAAGPGDLGNGRDGRSLCRLWRDGAGRSGPGCDRSFRCEGNGYLAAKFPHLDYIKKATIQ